MSKEEGKDKKKKGSGGAAADHENKFAGKIPP